jgi:hypothetical protein
MLVPPAWLTVFLPRNADRASVQPTITNLAHGDGITNPLRPPAPARSAASIPLHFARVDLIWY